MDIYIYDLQIDHIPNNINDVIVVDVFNKTMCQIIDMYSTDEYENLIHSEGFLKISAIKKCGSWKWHLLPKVSISILFLA